MVFIQLSNILKSVYLNEAKLSTLLAHNFVPVCSWIPETTRIDQKCLSYNFHLCKNAYHTISYNSIDTENVEKTLR